MRWSSGRMKKLIRPAARYVGPEYFVSTAKKIASASE